MISCNFMSCIFMSVIFSAPTLHIRICFNIRQDTRARLQFRAWPYNVVRYVRIIGNSSAVHGLRNSIKHTGRHGLSGRRPISCLCLHACVNAVAGSGRAPATGNSSGTAPSIQWPFPFSEHICAAISSTHDRASTAAREVSLSVLHCISSYIHAL